MRFNAAPQHHAITKPSERQLTSGAFLCSQPSPAFRFLVLLPIIALSMALTSVRALTDTGCAERWVERGTMLLSGGC